MFSIPPEGSHTIPHTDRSLLARCAIKYALPMRQVALAVTRNGVSLLKQLDRGYLERAVGEAGWELVRRTQVLGAPKMTDLDRMTRKDIEQWGWQSLNEAHEPRAEIAVLGAATEVNGRYPNDLSIAYKVPTDLPWFWVSPHYMESIVSKTG